MRKTAETAGTRWYRTYFESVENDVGKDYASWQWGEITEVGPVCIMPRASGGEYVFCLPATEKDSHARLMKFNSFIADNCRWLTELEFVHQAENGNLDNLLKLVSRKLRAKRPQAKRGVTLTLSTIMSPGP